MKTLAAVCDLAITPVSYDFITWLVRARMEALRQGCEGLHVVIMPKHDGRGGVGRAWNDYDDPETLFRFWHIVVPACQLAGASVAIVSQLTTATAAGLTSFMWYPQQAAHHAGDIVDAARAGEEIPRLTASAHARRHSPLPQGSPYRGVITFTRRNTPDHSRDSSDAAYIALREWCRDNRFYLIDIRDTRDALPFCDVSASIDIDARLALYQSADMNVFPNGGPTMLAWYSGAPFMHFDCAREGEWRAHWKKHLHLEPGDQLPWATPDQRLIYRPQTPTSVIEEIERWAMSRD